MTAHFSPSSTLRTPRDGQRSRHAFLSKPRLAGQFGAASAMSGEAAMDSVTKRFPGIGDTPSPSLKQRW
jgi:hypothetical protein